MEVVMSEVRGSAPVLLWPDALYATLSDQTSPQLLEGQALLVGGDGVIQALGDPQTLQALAPHATHLRLPGQALFPGFVNTHSHAFQRIIRGRTLSVPASNPDADFWSWRERMYAAACTLSAEAFEVVTAYTFLEMRRAGMTSVAEFHYIHHQPDGQPYLERNTLALAVVAAARRVGIRLTLLPVAYQRGGFGRAAEAGQRRFLSPTLDVFLEQVEALQALRAETGVEVGLAAHSVRAVPEDWLGPLKAFASQRGMVTHVHANEQRSEVRQCLEATGLRPTELLADRGFLDERTVVVHATHLSAREKQLLKRHRSQVSVCPTTERDLGDGMIDARGLLARAVPLSLGSDSHVQLDMFAEMRCLEGHERLKRRRRNVLLEPPHAGETRSIVPTLWKAATEAGAAALGQKVGRLSPGYAADGFTVRLDQAAFDGLSLAEVPAVLVAAGTPDLVHTVLVGGEARGGDGEAEAELLLRQDYARVARSLYA
jgi:formimidoylglutamate deiminase